MQQLISSPLQSFLPLVTFLLSLFIVYSSSDVCNDPPKHPNADPNIVDDSSTYTVNTTISYTCKRGYQSPGGHIKAQCVKFQNGTTTWAVTWQDPSLDCRPVSCGDPGEVQNGQRHGNLFIFPNRVNYTCMPGFKLKGLKSRYCQPSGLWSGRLPTCEAVQCPNLATPPNGNVNYQRDYGSEATYSCSNGFKLIINEERVCQANGSWSGVEPKCEEIKCPNITHLSGGNVLPPGINSRPGDIIILECNSPSSIKVTLKCLASGKWTDVPPVCPGAEVTPVEEITIRPSTITAKPGTGPHDGILCDDPGNIKNGERKYATEFSPGSTLTYYCQGDYELRGIATLTCLETGKWSSEKLPICVKPVPIPVIIGVAIGGFVIVSIIVASLWYFCWRKRKLHNPGMKNKASPSDASDLDEIRRLENSRKPIPVTTL